ncbi:MAG: hypothetical protein RLZZ241_2068 [Bacteroidota bacterium]|jgi:hypothetical protein
MRIRFLLSLGFILSLLRVAAQEDTEQLTSNFKVLAGDQIRLLYVLDKLPETSRKDYVLDSLYLPYREIWDSYWSTPDSLVEWVSATGLPQLGFFRNRMQRVGMDKIQQYWGEALAEVRELTGRVPSGACIVFFGPGTQSSRISDSGALLLDLNFPELNNAVLIGELLPHQLSKQLYFEQHREPIDELYALINAGLASQVTYALRKGNLTKAQALGFTEEAFAYCIREEDKLFLALNKILKAVKAPGLAAENDTHPAGLRLPEEIQYYLGYRIVESYIELHGESAWDDLFKLPPLEVVRQSGLLPE